MPGPTYYKARKRQVMVGGPGGRKMRRKHRAGKRIGKTLKMQERAFKYGQKKQKLQGRARLAQKVASR